MANKRVRIDESGTYRIELDGNWLLKDFSDFFHIYSEVYSMCFLLTVPDSTSEERFELLLARYPWKGGYSAVNFYDDLYREVGVTNRPSVREIQYASPGHLTLLVYLGAALSVRKIIQQFTKSGEAINGLYHSIYKSLVERKLLRLDVRERELDVTKKELDFIKSTYREFAALLQIPHPETLLKSSPNPLAALKVLLSLYRRARTLAEFSAKGKVKL